MQLPSKWKEGFQQGAYAAQWAWLYSGDAAVQRERHLAALAEFTETVGDSQKVCFISAPGRTELCGNHTDHQNGHILAGAVTMDMLAVAAPRQDGCIRLKSQGYGITKLTLEQLTAIPREEGSTKALIRGVAARLQELGHKIGGFSAYVTSGVPAGSGLSSSAALEILLGSIFSFLYNDGSLDPVMLAQVGQYTENRYFGKPCGLMDQLAASVGGAVAVDFLDLQNPKVESIPCDFDRMGYALYVVNAGGSHAGLTSEYAAIPPEMGSVAAYFGKKVLREVDEQTFYSKLGELRGKVSDRAILRAMHFFGDDRRAVEMAQALRAQDVEAYKAIMLASGASSMSRLENIYPAAGPKRGALGRQGRMAHPGGRLCRHHPGPGTPRPVPAIRKTDAGGLWPSLLQPSLHPAGGRLSFEGGLTYEQQTHPGTRGRRLYWRPYGGGPGGKRGPSGGGGRPGNRL